MGCRRALLRYFQENEFGFGNSCCASTSTTLMFGSTAAVYSFNRVSRRIWRLFDKMLLISCGVFYDDYPPFSCLQNLLKIPMSVIVHCLTSLGGSMLVRGQKASLFRNVFRCWGACWLCLGVMLSLRTSLGDWTGSESSLLGLSKLARSICTKPKYSMDSFAAPTASLPGAICFKFVQRLKTSCLHRPPLAEPMFQIFGTMLQTCWSAASLEQFLLRARDAQS